MAIEDRRTPSSMRERERGVATERRHTPPRESEPEEVVNGGRGREGQPQSRGPDV